jgi:DNA-binding NtrC family response regulator
MTERFPVLVASPDPEHQRALGRLLEQCGLEPHFVTTVRAAVEALNRRRVALAFCSEALSDGTFRDVLVAARKADVGVPVVVASRLDDTSEYFEAMSLGAFDFIAAPYGRREVEWIVNRALAQTLAAAG